MRKKIVSYFVVGLFVFSGLAAMVGIGQEAGVDEETMTFQFVEPTMTTTTINKETYIELAVDGAEAKLYHSGKPILPMYTTMLTLPFGTEIVNVECTPGTINTETISHKIIPAPQPVIPDITDDAIVYDMDSAIYGSDALYPSDWVSYRTGGGLDENSEHVTFFVLQVYPLRYSPTTNIIKYTETLEVTVTYNEPEGNPFPLHGEYDLVIIAPSKFMGTLDKLVTHKNDYGVPTITKTVESIDDEYEGIGVDLPERIKYFIKDAIEDWDIKYVLLVGGMKSLLWGNPRDDRNQGTASWYLPVRYTNLRDSGSVYDPGFISDLYYADIYDGDGNFSSWDSNDDGIFAKWDQYVGKDVIDFYPDVAVGRLACRNKIEVSIMVNKIINYEKSAAGSSWYDTMVVAGGDSHDDPGTNYIEGELVCDKVLDTYMTEVDAIKLYASNKDTDPEYTPQLANIVREISSGCGHMLFDGHANPASWTTHWVGEFEGPESWCEGIDVGAFPRLRNGGKLPVCNVEGCHNSQFNITLFSTLTDKDNSKKTWCYGNPVPECWSWWLARKVGGGSISTVGNTALGYGTVGEHGDIDGDGIAEPDCLEALGGYWFIQWYKTFDEGVDILGEVWAGAQNNYLDTFPGMDDQIDAKTVEQIELLGDPSLKIGGYSSLAGLKARIEQAAGVVAAPGEEVELSAYALDGQEPYTYEWDFTNDGITDATGETALWSWNVLGAYWVTLTVTDDAGNSDTFETIVVIQPHASTPLRPTGPTRIQPKQDYTFSTSISSTEWDRIYYRFSWGDGTVSDWTENPTATHTYDARGFYKIAAQAMLIKEDTKGTEDINEETVEYTEWSEPLSITVPRSRVMALPLLHRLFEQFPNAFPVLRQLLGL